VRRGGGVGDCFCRSSLPKSTWGVASPVLRPHSRCVCADIDGAYFGCTFPHLFLMTYPTSIPAPPPTLYVPRVFGFRVRRDLPALLGTAASPDAATAAAGARVAGSAEKEYDALAAVNAASAAAASTAAAAEVACAPIVKALGSLTLQPSGTVGVASVRAVGPAGSGSSLSASGGVLPVDGGGASVSGGGPNAPPFIGEAPLSRRASEDAAATSVAVAGTAGITTAALVAPAAGPAANFATSLAGLGSSSHSGRSRVAYPRTNLTALLPAEALEARRKAALASGRALDDFLDAEEAGAAAAGASGGQRLKESDDAGGVASVRSLGASAAPGAAGSASVSAAVVSGGVSRGGQPQPPQPAPSRGLGPGLAPLGKAAPASSEEDYAVSPAAAAAAGGRAALASSAWDPASESRSRFR